MVISKEQAKDLAITHVNSLDLKGYKYRFVGVSFDAKWANEWGAIFDVYTPKGHLMDGPIVFVVEKETGCVRGFKPN